MKWKIPIALVLLILILPVLTQATLIDDAYHFGDYEGSPNVADYGEWWFFNFYQEDIQGVVQYSLWDPAGLTEDSYGLMYVSVFQEDVIDIYFPIPWSYILTSDVTADLIMGPNTIQVIDGQYQLDGYVEDLFGGTDNSIGWSLLYIPDSSSLLGFRNFNIFPLDPNEEMNWYVQTPSAIVQGVLVVNGELIPINARGYHDHNWGTWKLYHGLWNWFQTNEPSLAIAGYDFYTLPEGNITILLDDVEVVFEKDEYSLTNLGWTFHSEAFTVYPAKTIITANNDEYSLYLKITVKQTGLVGRVYDDPPLAWTVFESKVLFKGKLTKRGTLVKKINMTGFKEYTTNVMLP